MSDLAIESAVAEIISGTSVIRQTTLAAQATSGATTITVSSATGLYPGQLVLFRDALGEEPLTIASISGTTVTLDFTALGYSSLQHTHPINTVVCVNLLDFAPVKIADMLSQGDPVVWYMVADEQNHWVATRLMQPTYDLHIQYHRSLIRPSGQQMDPNLWARRQQRAAKADLETIAQAFRTNPRLQASVMVSAPGPQAEDLGQRGVMGKPIIAKSWRKLGKSADTQQFAAGMDLTVRGLRSTQLF